MRSTVPTPATPLRSSIRTTRGRSGAIRTTDPDFQIDWGIGPGCARAEGSDTIRGLPPVRIREVAEQLSSDPLRSVCDEDFEPIMLELIDRLVDDDC
ncbi:hypothetical protein G6O69_28945 [Pseudenhygromyxa sp. WMMC2535]|uniref:hypothetical protein n=1 Tax=Pseudenhygromyxa sp. WMMC2535 TaxID=2712867 RepID=UPI0015962353|nr:hypothetical protein [Pseudenhygromyxa sp. WMMC2535]NVB41893.1 hypothetical protein [Pseudenhygromyxa sp. WMMC2535]